ncbi:hypothetical protein EPR50_G00041770 [Perca flavescens]|uniref:Bcl-2-like protein 15 n=1 Tax=Perca flavescens TaxID=8167 RepID=A0A484DG81_PERFV|nr:hypothetical protein EPR50_G00041770 [Perca flavescens]
MKATMAPSEDIVKWQTSQIIKYLLEDEEEYHSRCLLDAGLEVDSITASNDDNFDPVQIADKLRSVADALNDDPRFQTALTDLKKAAANEAFEAAFSHSMETLCQTQVSQRAEVASEMQLIRASVAFGLYVIKSSPDLKFKVQSAMTAFLGRPSVVSWVTRQGGWDKVKDV